MRSGSLTLYIDTSSSTLYTGLVEDEHLLGEVREDLGKDLSTYALARIRKMFQDVQRNPQDITRIIVVNGPGSFTGIRVGITIAKTFAWLLKKDITTVTSLEAMAISTVLSTLKVPCIDARRGYVFAGVYDSENHPILPNQYIRFSELVKILETYQNPYQFIGTSLDEISSVSYNPDILRIVSFCKNKKSVNPHSVNPEYLKQTEAEETKGITCE